MNTNDIRIKNSTLDEIKIPLLLEKNIRLFVKRDDLIHPEVSGNKWRKLKYNIQKVEKEQHTGILTFGGAYSNHLLATASACNLLGMKSIGYIRGEELSVNSNETLRRCHELGMELHFISRELYFMRNDFEFKKELKVEHPGFYIVPEGGNNYYGMLGCQEIWEELKTQTFDHIFLAQGTTTTSCGILLGAPEKSKIHGIPILKGFDSKKTMFDFIKNCFFDEELASEIMEKHIEHEDYHFGGYAKYNSELLKFIQEIYKKYNLPLDPVYTAKAFYGMLDVIQKENYSNCNILFIHTGGLQGIHTIEKKENIKLFVK